MTRSLRQAFPLPLPVETGATGALLGSSMAACPGAGFVAGAPGTGTAWHSPSGLTPPAQGHGLGRTVACYVTASGTTEMLAGGDAGVRKSDTGSWVAALTGTGASVLSISASDVAQAPFIVGTTTAVAFYDRSNGAAIGNFLAGVPGEVVLWYPGQLRMALTPVVGAQVRIYDVNPNTGAVTLVNLLANGAPGFGRALAVGDVLPPPGPELLVGASGAVFIYAGNGTGPLMRLSGDSSFGESLATAATGLGIDALFVGEPANDQVHRFFGDAGEVFTSAAVPERLGASLAVNLNQLAIGAPGHAAGAGGVYVVLLNPGTASGEAQACTVGRACFSQTCLAGECVGGVFCDLSAAFYECQQGETCSAGRCFGPDGGAIGRDAGNIDPDDAGVIIDDGGALIRPDASVALDAGDEADAGRPDAGVDGGFDGGGVKPPKDAGAEPDAGAEKLEPMIFTTSGCSQSAGLPVLALGLAWLRRRHRERSAPLTPAPLPAAQGEGNSHLPLRGRGMA